MRVLLEQHWLSSTPNTKLKMLFVSLGSVCWNLHESKFEWDETRLDQRHCLGVVVTNGEKSAVFWKIQKNWKNSQKRVFLLWSKTVPSIWLSWCWTKTETQQNKKNLFGQPKQNKTIREKEKTQAPKFRFVEGLETMTRSLLSSWCFAEFLAALCIIIVWAKRVVRAWG